MAGGTDAREDVKMRRRSKVMDSGGGQQLLFNPTPPYPMLSLSYSSISLKMLESKSERGSQIAQADLLSIILWCN